MKKKTCLKFFSSLLCFSLTIDAFTLPKEPQVISGISSFNQVDPHTIEIRPSDQAIINYTTFDIGKNEKVKFIQNSSSSCVLNRITKENPSQIFGSLESNGKVFLVNPSGVFFGPNSQVNVGSLIVSTLDISDTDFLQENYEFSLGSRNSNIRNEGVLNSTEGSIALISSKIQNIGSITAKAGSVVLASGEYVTLDFTGDGLLNFSVEGTLKEALIEQLGDISASIVQLKIPAAKKAISEMVNLEGIEEGDIFIEENGLIKFASAASIEAQKVLLNASNLEVKGSINAQSFDSIGGEVHLIGRDISLEGSQINVSGLLGGGEVLIGGEYQGTGKTPWASKVSMDKDSVILSNATEIGDGGLVVLWSQGQTIFNGKIEANAGAQGGDGGLIETSSKGGLQIASGKVDALSPLGTIGTWLLDPTTVQIVSSVTTTQCSSSSNVYGNCNSGDLCQISVGSITNSGSTVTVQAYAYIDVMTDIIMQNANAGITLQTCSPISGTYPDFQITISAEKITTKGGPVNIDMSASKSSTTSPWIYLDKALIIDTTNGGDASYLAGANISFSGDVVSVNSACNLTLQAGTNGVITTGDDVSLYGSFTVNGAMSTSLYGLVSASKGITIPSSVTTSFIGKTVNGALQGQFASSTGDIIVGPVQASTASTALRFTSGSSQQVIVNGAIGGGSIVPSEVFCEVGTAHISSVTAQGSIKFNGDVVLKDSSNITSTNGPIIFSNKIDGSATGAQSLTINAGLGDLSIKYIGSNVSLGAVSLTANEIKLTSSATSWTGTSFNIQGAITSTNASLEIINSGIFNLKSGSNSSLIGDFKQTGSGAVTLASNITANNITFASLITLASTISLESLGILTLSTDVEGTVAGSQGLTLTSVLPLNIQDLGVVTALGPVNISALTDSTIQNITTLNGTITLKAPSFTIGKSITIDSTNWGASGALINIEGDIEALNAGVETLRIDATGTSSAAGINIKGSVGKTKALGSFKISGDSSIGGSLFTLGDSLQESVSISAAGDITIEPLLVLASSALLSGSDVEILQNAIASTAGSQSLTVNATGSITATELGNTSSAFGKVSLTALSTSSIRNVITGGGEITLSAPSFIISAVDNITAIDSTAGGTFVGAAISITGAIDATTSGVEALAIGATGVDNVAGLISISGPIGATAPVAFFKVTGNSSIYDSKIQIGDSLLPSTSICAIEYIDMNDMHEVTLVSSLFLETVNGTINIANPHIDATAAGGQSLTIDAGIATIDIGRTGFNTAVGAVDVTCGLFRVWGIRTDGSPININGDTSLRISSVTLDTTNDNRVTTGADITFSGVVDSDPDNSSAFTITAGSNGIINFASDVGSTIPPSSIEILTASDVNVKNITAVNGIAIIPHSTLSNSLTTFTSNLGSDVLLGDMDGTINSNQSLTVSTELGRVELGVIGASIVLDEVKVPTGLEAAIHSITVSGSIAIDIPIILAASSTLSTIGDGASGSTITFKSINGTTVGVEDLTVTTGVGDIIFTDRIGYVVPPGNLDMTADAIEFESTLVIAAGSHSYHAPVTMSQDMVFRSLGDITFDAAVEPATDSLNLILYPGSGTLTFTGSVGDAPFGDISVYNAGSFSAQDITARTLRVLGGLPSIFLYGDITTTGPLGVVFDAGPINFGAEISASHIWARSYGSMSVLDPAQVINISGDSPIAFEYFNAIGGNIGSSTNPIQFNAIQKSTLGAGYSVDFVGDPFHSVFFLAESNPPCLITFNGVNLLNCNLVPTIQQDFNIVPKDFWYMTWAYSSWYNFSNLEFFEQESRYPMQNPKEGKLMHWAMTRRQQKNNDHPPAEAFKNVEIIGLEKPVSYEKNLIELDNLLERAKVKDIVSSESLVIKIDMPSSEQIIAATREIGFDIAKERIIETSEAAILHSAKNMEPINLVIADKVFSGLSSATAAMEFKKMEVAVSFEIENPNKVEEIQELREEKASLLGSDWPFDTKVILEEIKDQRVSKMPTKEEVEWGFFLEFPKEPFPLDLLID